jgi:hypothetical protein
MKMITNVEEKSYISLLYIHATNVFNVSKHLTFKYMQSFRDLIKRKFLNLVSMGMLFLKL